MDIVYVAMSALTETDRKALKAVVEPMLMSDMTIVKHMVKITEFVGTRKRWSILASQGENTMPLSRANAFELSTCNHSSDCSELTNVCRTVDAIQLVPMMTNNMSNKAVNPVAPPAEPVLFKKTVTIGKPPVGAARVLSRSGMQKT